MGLSALDGHEGFLGAEIAGHHAEFRLEDIVEDERDRVGLRARARARHDHLLLAGVVEALEGGPLPGDAQAHIAADGADPLELAHVIAGIARADQRLGQRPAGESAHDPAILGGGIGDEIGGADAASARHVLHIDGGIARNIFADMAAQHARIEINAPARRARHIDGDGLGHGLALLGEDGRGGGESQGAREGGKMRGHGSSKNGLKPGQRR